MRERDWKKIVEQLRVSERAFAERKDGDMEELIDILRDALRALHAENAELRERIAEFERQPEEALSS